MSSVMQRLLVLTRSDARGKRCGSHGDRGRGSELSIVMGIIFNPTVNENSHSVYEIRNMSFILDIPRKQNHFILELITTVIWYMQNIPLCALYVKISYIASAGHVN